MTTDDQSRVSVLVSVPPDLAFATFTEDIDRWWRRGPKYRVGGGRRGIVHLEPRPNGRLYESFEVGAETKIFETGTILVWEPPARLVFEWRTSNFAPDEKTVVEVLFEPSPSGTLVTVTHRGWSKIRPDHPVRHGQDVGAFLRMNGLWWAEQMSSLRELVAR